ncbi:MAG: hypothetical protein R6V49_00075 [Bacteroidales bacterium]
MKIFKQILLTLIFIVILVFTFQNFSMVLIKFLNWKIEMPLFVSLVLFYILGGISGGLLLSLIREATRPKKSVDGLQKDEE